MGDDAMARLREATIRQCAAVARETLAPENDFVMTGPAGIVRQVERRILALLDYQLSARATRDSTYTDSYFKDGGGHAGRGGKVKGEPDV